MSDLMIDLMNDLMTLGLKDQSHAETVLSCS